MLDIRLKKIITPKPPMVEDPHPPPMDLHLLGEVVWDGREQNC